MESKTFSLSFRAPDRLGRQVVTLRCAPAAACRPGGPVWDPGASTLLASGLTGSNLAVQGGGTLRAGLFEDPFFDLAAFRNGLAFFTGVERTGESMTVRRLLATGVAAAALIAGSYVFRPRQPDAARPETISIGFAGAQQAFGMKSTDELVAFWRSRFERDPRDFISVAYLGEAFLRKARETGNVADYDRAEAALRASLAIKPDYPFAVAHLGAVLFSKHEFGDALELAGRVYAADRRALQALATVGDAHLELGNHAAAAAAYEQLAARDSDPAVLSRRAHLVRLQGQTDAAIDLMAQAAADAATMGLSPENAAWYEYQLGELYFGAGRTDEASRHYAAALARFDHYYLALAGLAKARAAQGRLDDAVALYTQAVAIIPQPEFLAALGDVYAVLGRGDDARQQYDTVEVIGTLAAVNDAGREEAPNS